MKIGNREFVWEKNSDRNHTYVMGILNVTPDSFSDGGQYLQLDQALVQTEKMVKEGCDLIDLGGESTRPGFQKVEAREEMERVLPVIEGIKRRFDIPVSLDTYKSEVASEGIKAGADLINDIWGLKADPKMASVIAAAKVPCCLMHNRNEALYEDFITDVMNDLRESVVMGEQAGIRRDQIILDPGAGFGKTYEHNLKVMKNLSEFHKLDLPILLGTSRKSVIGLTLDLPVDQRLEGTLVTTVFAVLAGCMFVRVHDVKENLRAIKMAEAIRDCMQGQRREQNGSD